MNNEIMTAEYRQLEDYYNNACSPYEVNCKILSEQKNSFSNQNEQYLVLSIYDTFNNISAKELFVRNERSEELFYTDYFVIKLNDDIGLLEMVDDATAYCKTVKFLKDLYNEFDANLPLRIRGDEIGGLKDFNSGRKNQSLSPKVRKKYQKGLKKFFRQEKTKSKYHQKWRTFMRSDKYDKTASFFEMFKQFHNRQTQVVDISLLQRTHSDLNTTLINEHEFVKFKELLQHLYPDVIYSVSNITEKNEGFDLKYLNRPIDEIPETAYGKCVSYEMYCNEVLRRFASDGYSAVQNLHPSYYETRQLTYREIDEPFIAHALNSVRFAYAKSATLESVKNTHADLVSYVDVPVSDMMNFVSLIRANGIPVHFDFEGRFNVANFEIVRAIYNPENDAKMHDILKRMVVEKMEMSHISTSIDKKSPSLEGKINEAQHLNLLTTYESNFSKSHHIEI